jgi:hypothetical protein
MSELIGAFLRAECGHKRADPAREARNGWFGSFPEMCLEFAEGLLDRVEVRGIFRKITELGAGCFNDLTYCGNPVHRKAVHHHNVAALEFWNKTFFEVGHEDRRVHGPIKYQGRDHRGFAAAVHVGSD